MLRISQVFLLSLLFSFNFCKKDTYYLKVSSTDEPENADITIKNFSAEGYTRSQRKWVLKADTSYVMYASSKIVMHKLRIQYNEASGIVSILRAEKGILDRNSNDMVIEDGVNVKSSNGRELYTNVLFWNDKRKELSTDSTVKIIYPGGEVIQGDGLKTDGTLSKISIRNPIGTHNPHEQTRKPKP